MKAAVVKGKRLIVAEEVPIPSVEPGTLLLKTRYCSICGSDLEYLDGHVGGIHPGAILGHEWVAEVAAVGEEVRGWTVGERVTVGGGLVPCGLCYFCRRGLYRWCTGDPSLPRQETGYASASGAMAEYFVRPPVAIQKVPDGLSDEEAALVEPLATGAGAVEAARLRPGDTAVVIGAGKIGLGAMLCAKAAGASPVIVATRKTQSRLDKALEMGADAVVNASKVDMVSEVKKLTGVGPDAVLICSREWPILNEAVRMVRHGGIIVLAGSIPPQEVNVNRLVMRQIKIEGIMGGSLTTSLSLIAHQQVNVKPLVSEIMPLKEVQKAFDSMWSGKNIVVLLKP